MRLVPPLARPKVPGEVHELSSDTGARIAPTSDTEATQVSTVLLGGPKHVTLT